MIVKQKIYKRASNYYLFVCVLLLWDFGLWVYIFKVTGSSTRPRDAYRRRIAGQGVIRVPGSPAPRLRGRAVAT